LVDSAEKQFIKINKTDYNINYQTYYFYKYFKAFLQALTQNNKIFSLSYDQAIKKATNQITDIYFLDKIIIYFEILKQSDTNLFIFFIQKKYNKDYYPLAKSLIIKKFKYITPKKINDFDLFKPTIS
ncbi:22037_t:CDS:1, partial [Cetraspora pellucida]